MHQDSVLFVDIHVDIPVKFPLSCLEKFFRRSWITFLLACCSIMNWRDSYPLSTHAQNIHKIAADYTTLSSRLFTS